MGGSSDTKLNIIVDAQDKTGSAFSSVKGELDKTTMSMEGMTDAMNSVGKVGAVAFSALSVGVGFAIKEATEANMVLAQLDAVLGSTAGKAGVTKEAAIDLAESLAEVTLFTDDAILSAQNMLLTFTNIGKDVFPTATETALNMSQALGQDLQSSAVQLGKALNDPIDGITALSRVGVTFTDDQKAMIESMVLAGDTMGAQKLILAELNTEFGNSARLVAEADPFAMMKKSVGELMESIGTSLLPVFTDLLARIQPIIDKVMVWAEENPKLIETIVIIGLVLTSLMAVMLPISLMMPGLIMTFTGLATAFTFLASGPGLVLIGYLVALGAAIYFISGIVKLLKNDWDVTWLGMQLSLAEVVNNIIISFENMINFIISGINVAIRAINSLLERLAGLPKIGEMFEGLKIAEIEAVTLAKIDTDGIVDNFNAGQQAAVQNTVNINGGTYLDPDVAQDIGDTIIDTLQLSSTF